MSYSINSISATSFQVLDPLGNVCGDFVKFVDVIRAVNALNGGDGLTKRERFAMAAMQGLCAANMGSNNEMIDDHNVIADLAVDQADALIAELDKDKS